MNNNIHNIIPMNIRAIFKTVFYTTRTYMYLKYMFGIKTTFYNYTTLQLTLNILVSHGFKKVWTNIWLSNL